MPTIAEAKEHIEHYSITPDAELDMNMRGPLLAACEIAMLADAYFKLSCQTREEDRVGLVDARHALWEKVKKARENELLQRE